MISPKVDKTIFDCPVEIHEHIIRYLDIESFIQLTKTCRFLNYSKTKRFWSLFLPGTALPLPSENYTLFYRQFQKLCRQFDRISISLPQSYVSVSSRDSIEQGGHCVLHDNDTFWSSVGSASSDSDEFITLKLYSTSLLSKISIMPYKAVYQRRVPIYAPLKFMFLIGFTMNEFHYQSPEFEIENKNQMFDFDVSSLFAFGLFVKVVLIGKRTRQPGDELFYTALQRIKIEGVEMNQIEKYSELVNVVKTHCTQKQIDLSEEDSDYDGESSERRLTFEAVLNECQHYELMMETSGHWSPLFAILASHPTSSLYRSDKVLKYYLDKAEKIAVKNHIKEEAWEAYLSHLLDSTQHHLTHLEARKFAVAFLYGGWDKLFWDYRRRIPMSEALGDLFRDCNQHNYAFSIYALSNVSEKATDSLIKLKRFDEAIRLLLSGDYPLEKFKQVIDQLLSSNFSLAKQFAQKWLLRDPQRWQSIAEMMHRSDASLEEFTEWININLY
jgi:hypothetical protein